MVEDIESGVRLGLLLDPESRTAWIHRPDHEPRKLDAPTEIDLGVVLPGFVLQLATIWG
jgi:Uma2 family endonuclease